MKRISHIQIENCADCGTQAGLRHVRFGSKADSGRPAVQFPSRGVKLPSNRVELGEPIVDGDGFIFAVKGAVLPEEVPA